MVRIKSNHRQFTHALGRLPQEVEREVTPTLLAEMTKVLRLSRNGNYHRYTTRSGNLERSGDVQRIEGGVMVIYRDKIADYAKHIHEGFKSWRADQFLYKAFEARTDKITKAMRDKISSAIRKVFR